MTLQPRAIVIPAGQVKLRCEGACDWSETWCSYSRLRLRLRVQFFFLRLFASLDNIILQ